MNDQANRKMNAFSQNAKPTGTKRRTAAAALCLLAGAALLAMLFSSCGIGGGASTGLKFTSNGDGTCSVSVGSCRDEKVVIPDKSPEGDVVTGIREQGFYNCPWLTSVSIPASVTSIGQKALAVCDNLVSIVVDENNTVLCSKDNCIIDRATQTLIAGCKASVIPSDGSVTAIGDGAFLSCESLTDITIPDSVTSIGTEAFSSSGLTSLTFPASVTSVGENAFAGCPNLSTITIQEGATRIVDGAFYNCTGLTNVIIPDTVKTIGACAFDQCTKLTDITIPNSVTSIESCAFAYTDLTSVTIPNSVTSIGAGAFQACKNLTSVTIPDSVTSIGLDAFEYCDQLTIYCDISCNTEKWHPDWNISGCPIVWTDID